MKCNVGKTDRWIRIVAGVLIAGSNYVNYYFFHNPYYVWANIGWIPLLTGIFRWCPLYALFGISTVEKSK
ncbi:MAG TPA: DUF2892 domain-containing protein [bacterium]|nr:DUF2892 domain-containing protein [bacterium]HQG44450.1 DUF2892 domain-containing protein [bacterium]HQI47535.1 DUF2892 domain-containing protein [bacterium]HQJ63111.1 DUF2892 domain-containing protein [bacterium]